MRKYRAAFAVESIGNHSMGNVLLQGSSDVLGGVPGKYLDYPWSNSLHTDFRGVDVCEIGST